MTKVPASVIRSVVSQKLQTCRRGETDVVSDLFNVLSVFTSHDPHITTATLSHTNGSMNYAKGKTADFTNTA